MKKFASWSLLLVSFVTLGYLGGEWWLTRYSSQIAAERALHHFDRTLVVFGEPAAKFSLAKSTGNATIDPGVTAQTEIISSRGLQWVRDRGFVEGLYSWSVQTWDVGVGSKLLNDVAVYGIDARSMRAFDLGNPTLIAEGSLVLSDHTYAQFQFDSKQERDATLSMPERILAQMPKGILDQFRAASRVPMQLSANVIAHPPGINPKKHVAYVSQDGDQINGMMMPATIHLILVREGYSVDEALSEIRAYLAMHETQTSLGVQPAAGKAADYFPPLISTESLAAWITALRAFLIIFLLVIGFGVSLSKMRQCAFEIALRTALGEYPRRAFFHTYKLWFAGIFLAMLLPLILVCIAYALMRTDLSLIARPSLILLLGFLGLASGTYLASVRALRSSPLLVLSKSY